MDHFDLLIILPTEGGTVITDTRLYPVAEADRIFPLPPAERIYPVVPS